MQHNPKPAGNASGAPASTVTRPYPYGPPSSLLEDPARMAAFQQAVAPEVAAAVAAGSEAITPLVIVREA